MKAESKQEERVGNLSNSGEELEGALMRKGEEKGWGRGQDDAGLSSAWW